MMSLKKVLILLVVPWCSATLVTDPEDQWKLEIQGRHEDP